MVIKSSELGGSSGSASNDFTLNLGTSGYTKSTLSTTFPIGSYVVTSANLDSSLDIYLLAEDGSVAGAANAGSTSFTITASKAFNAIVVYGGTNSEALSFVFKYVFNTSANSTTDLSIGPRITAVSPSSVPNQGDTLSITGQNFATDVEITFTGSDAVARSAKSIVRGSSTSLTVTRPDNLPITFNPYTITATNPGTTSPTSSNANKSINSVSAGAAPVWVTSSGNLSTPYKPGFAFSQSVSATDSDGGSSIVYTIASGSLPTGLTLSSAGLISGTSSVTGNTTFSVRATDSGNNFVDRSFTLVQQLVPDAPTNITVAKGGLGAIAVSFTAPAYTGSSAISGYRVTASSGGGTQTGSSSPITRSGLTQGASYTFTVAATNSTGYGAESTASSSIGAPGQFSQTFNASGTWSNPGVTSVEVLSVGGGGGGGNANTGGSSSGMAGGGGAGGLVYHASLPISANTANYSVTVGNGGGASSSGSQSVFANITSYGGGGGAGFNGGLNTTNDAQAGGSGGGPLGGWGGNNNAKTRPAANIGLGPSGSVLLGNQSFGGGSNTWSGGGGGAGSLGGGTNYGSPYGPVTYFGSSYAAGGAAGSPYGDYGITPGGRGGYAGDTRADAGPRIAGRATGGANGTGSGGGGETSMNTVQDGFGTNRSGTAGGNGVVIVRWTF
jgi:large repetitive protein